MESVTHCQTRQLLHNKYIVVLGDSIQRSVYKDLVVLLQRNSYLTLPQLKSKGELSFEQDCLVEGGRLGQMTNGTEYREVRQYCSSHHLVRFYFLTRIYSAYMESILNDFKHGLKPDLVIVNSCVWDVSRYNRKWISEYKDNLNNFFSQLRAVLPDESLILWNMTMPLGEKITGGFLVPEIQSMGLTLRYDVIEANFYGATLANANGLDVLDLHFLFRFSLQHRMKDGVHWNAVAHRHITWLVLQHVAQAWGVELTSASSPGGPCGDKRCGNPYMEPEVFGHADAASHVQQAKTYDGLGPCFYEDNLLSIQQTPGYFSFNSNIGISQTSHNRNKYVMKRERHSKRTYAPYVRERPKPSHRC